MSTLPSWDSIPAAKVAPLTPESASPASDSYQLPAPRVSSSSVQLADKDKINALGTAYANFMQVITLDHFDEGTALIDSTLPKWMGGRGGTYEENLQLVRAQIEQGNEDNPTSSWLGFGAGMFVPMSWLGRGKKGAEAVKATSGLGRMVAEGAALGAVQGFGASEATEYFTMERVKDGLYGAGFGAAGGYVLGSLVIPGVDAAGSKARALLSRGFTPKLDFKFKVGERPTIAKDVADDLSSLRKSEAPTTKAPANRTPKDVTETTQVTRTNPLTGQADDVIEDGALFSTKEAATAANAKVLDDAIGRASKLTPEEAKTLSKKFDKARASGNLADDPHYRAILGIDLENATDDVQAATDAAVFLEDIVKAVKERAGHGAKTVDQMEREARRLFGGQLSETEIDRYLSKVEETKQSANVGTSIMMIAGMQFAQAAKEIMPNVLKGVAGSREALVEKLTTAIRISAKGQIMVSEAGRNLGMLSKPRSLVFTEVTDGAVQVEARKAIQARVQASIDALGDDELVTLLSRVKDLSDLEKVGEVLTNVARAEEVSGWIKARNTAGLWLKSNSLTPMSGVINTVGFVLHDLFRNSWARSLAAHIAEKAGQVDDALILGLQKEVVKAVRWQAHGVGVRAALQRIKWETLESIEKIARTAGVKGELRASTSRMAMIADGYTPPPLREVDFEQTLGVTDFNAFNQRLEAKASGSALGALAAMGERVGATAFAVVNELATTTGRVVSGVLDDWGRAYVKVSETYAEMAGFAATEGIAAGKSGDDLVKYVQQRTADLAELPPTEILARVEQKLVNGDDLGDVDKALLRRDWEAEKEAERVLFTDGPQTEGGRVAAAAASKLDKVAGGFALPGILMTYIRTPTRIFERGLVSYTPWAAKAEEVQTILARAAAPNATKADVLAGALEQARIELGTTVIAIGMAAAASGAITVTNGGWKSSANLTGEPANRLNLPGGGYVELSRLDPFALSLAMGGAIGQAYKAAQDAEDQYGRDEAITTAVQTAFLALRESILEKSYMTSARDLLKAAFSEEEGAVDGYSKMLGNAITRLVPLSGATRQLQETFSGQAKEAVSFMDRLFKTIPGMGGYLPARVDAIGNDVEGRFMGLAAGTTSDSDELTKALAAEGLDLTNLAKADPTGFDLTSEELSELRRIRAWEATNPDGLTMREALADMLQSADYQSLPSKEQKQDRVVEVMREFNNPARDIFEERNQDYLSKRETFRSFRAYMSDGMAAQQASREALVDTAASGLPAPSITPQ